MSTKRSINSTSITVGISMFLVMSGFGIVFPILPFYAREMGASPLEMGLMVTLFALAQFLFSPLWGNLSDRIGRKPVLIWGLAGYGISFFAMAAAGSVWSLTAVRAVSGILSAAAFPTAQAIVADSNPGRERAAAIGSLAASMNLGFILGPAIGGLLAPLGAQNVFILSGAVVMITSVATAVFLREPEVTSDRQRLRPLEIITSLPRVLSGSLAYYLLLTLIITLAGSGMFSMFSYYMMDRLHAVPVHTGYAFTVMGLGSCLVQYTLVAPAIAYVGERVTILLSLLVGMLAFSVMASGSTLALFFLGSLLAGAAMGMLRPVLMTAVSVRSTYGQGFTMGIYSSCDNMGRMVGPLWAGFVYGFGITLPFWSAALMFLFMLIIVHPHADDKIIDGQLATETGQQD